MAKSNAAPNEVIIAPDLASYFEEQVQETARKQGQDISPFTARYLGGVLARFANAQNFFVRANPNAPSEFPTLALMWLESFGHPSADEFFKLQQMGDVALFTSGFLGERIDRRHLDRDYYAAMGGMAYERAGRIRESLQADRKVNVYFELAERFAGFTEILAELSDQSLLGSDRDLLKLYEKWLASGSHRIARMLGERGVIAGRGTRHDEES